MDSERSRTCERLIDALDDYLDGLDGGEGAMPRAEVEAHLAHCPACAALAADVRALRAAARTLAPIEPPAHVWHAVRARIDDERPAHTSWRERVGWPSSGWQSVFQPLGAAAVLVLVVSGLAWVGTRMTGEAPRTARAGDAAGPLVEFQLAQAEYADAIDRLEEATQSGTPRLDALTNETLRVSIDDIDMAIDDAREALAREPGNAVSQESLLDALSSKVALLQDTVAMLGDLEPAAEVQTP